MDEPRTHYQVSFTSRQGVALFAGAIAALVAAYFLGLMTGLAGGEGRPSAGAAAAATPVPETAFPAPVLGVAARGPSVRATAKPAPPPTEAASAAPTPALQLFEDRPFSEPTKPAAAPAAAPRPAVGKAQPKPPEPAGFWVQVDSLSSKDQAEARRRGLGSAGFKAGIFPGAGPKGAVYRVRVGPFATRDDAERAAQQLERKAKVSNLWVVPPGQ